MNTRGFKIKIMNEYGDVEQEFPSITQFAYHLGASESRVRLKLAGQRIFTKKEYDALQQWVYCPITKGPNG